MATRRAPALSTGWSVSFRGISCHRNLHAAAVFACDLQGKEKKIYLSLSFSLSLSLSVCLSLSPFEEQRARRLVQMVMGKASSSSLLFFFFLLRGSDRITPAHYEVKIRQVSATQHTQTHKHTHTVKTITSITRARARPLPAPPTHDMFPSLKRRNLISHMLIHLCSVSPPSPPLLLPPSFFT